MLQPHTNASAKQKAIIRAKTDYVFTLMTIKELSEKTGICDSTLRVAKHRGKFSIETAQIVANVLGFTLYDLRPDCVGIVDESSSILDPKITVSFYIRKSLVKKARDFIKNLRA